eukprot:TRINITY_DN70909_c0_g1_i1.p1 TRINITY_DN70909_c0_g1~~TRINITY_DN70909_c0_g1_i1.p1  ORF type:complete len:224 (+),score=18.08 TRINITY_DN70909_c0_g1_i1:56-673(+)
MEARLHLQTDDIRHDCVGQSTLTSGSRCWHLTGNPMTRNDTSRSDAVERGRRITSDVGGHTDGRLGELPVGCQSARAYGATLTQRQRTIDAELEEVKKAPVIWAQHDHEKSLCDRKQLRPMRVAGVNSARLHMLRSQATVHRPGNDNRPPWMKKDEHLPGGLKYSPADVNGNPTKFGIDSHYSSMYGHSRGWDKGDATFKPRPGR